MVVIGAMHRLSNLSLNTFGSENVMLHAHERVELAVATKLMFPIQTTASADQKEVYGWLLTRKLEGHFVVSKIF